MTRFQSKGKKIAIVAIARKLAELMYILLKNDTSYEFAINEDILRIAGVDFTLKNGIKEDTTVYTFNFKVLKEGNTKVSFDNAEVVDKDASVIKHTNKDLDITINTQEETKEEEIVEEVKQEVKNDTKEIKKEIKETKEEVKEEKEETPIVEETKEEKTNVFKEIIKNIIDAIIKIFNRK